MKSLAIEKEKISFLMKNIPLSLWNKFKDKIPRSKTINDAILELIAKEVNKK